MARLSDLSISSVASAIAEFKSVGRQAFLSKYGFDSSRDYFLYDDGDLIDTKPIIAAAHGYRFPDRGPLTPDQFSGGVKGAVAVLRGMGHRVETRAVLFPPRLGDEYESRTDVYAAYGGDKVAGIVCFPGEAIVNVFSDADGPYADDPPTLTSPFGYRGQGLIGPQRVYSGGNQRLERARLSGEPVRFWYKPPRGKFGFLTWAVVLGRSWTAGVGADGISRPELDWHLQPVPGPEQREWPSAVAAVLEDSSVVGSDDDNGPESSPSPTYSQLVARVEQRGQPRRPTGVIRTDYARSAAARRAVLVRSGGRCEGPNCTGMPSEPNRLGEPILDVDHINDLAKGGEDHPRNMVALCPNCHAVKTRGANQGKNRTALLKLALAAHTAMTVGAP